uniref:Uncharacterized protein n=1 Tax=Physcomitrium patens TaxID=3218 RepID=A0A2K1IX89_PHYPA|nr:hypothetical protein PHYPA_023716 [Physcomitrium patens]
MSVFAQGEGVAAPGGGIVVHSAPESTLELFLMDPVGVHSHRQREHCYSGGAAVLEPY